MRHSREGLVFRKRMPAEGQSEMQWYAATLVFASSVGRDQSLRPLCEERTVLFAATDEQKARNLAVQHGLSEEHSYRNTRAESVTWRFMGIDALNTVPSDEDALGWEVASRYTRRSLKRLRALQRTTVR